MTTVEFGKQQVERPFSLHPAAYLIAGGLIKVDSDIIQIIFAKLHHCFQTVPDISRLACAILSIRALRTRFSVFSIIKGLLITLSPQFRHI
jgi:hypothetical protein